MIKTSSLFPEFKKRCMSKEKITIIENRLSVSLSGRTSKWSAFARVFFSLVATLVTFVSAPETPSNSSELGFAAKNSGLLPPIICFSSSLSSESRKLIRLLFLSSVTPVFALTCVSKKVVSPPLAVSSEEGGSLCLFWV